MGQADAVTARTLASSVTVPNHVVFREFAQETVLLDIESGQYFGLNPTAGRMLAVLQESDSVQGALPTLREDFPDAGDVLEADLCTLCQALSKRGLVVLEPVD
ncbi:MAG TPA: PqqD family protein [Thermoleophilaceae bacterium]|nr:PqqD family protein [Thermoleophilaceae bacterium]